MSIATVGKCQLKIDCPMSFPLEFAQLLARETFPRHFLGLPHTIATTRLHKNTQFSTIVRTTTLKYMVSFSVQCKVFESSFWDKDFDPWFRGETLSHHLHPIKARKSKRPRRLSRSQLNGHEVGCAFPFVGQRLQQWAWRISANGVDKDTVYLI